VPAAPLPRVRAVMRRVVARCGVVLLLAAMSTGCNGSDQTLARLAAFQRLHTATSTSPVPPSHVYCGNIKKSTRGPGHCAGIGTDANGPIAAYERTEMRGWIVAGPDWTEPDEQHIDVLLDWGWSAEAGIRAINTPERIMETLTPFNVLMFGVDAAGNRALVPSVSGDAWGGARAAVVHVESQAWRFSDPAPSGWNITKTNPAGMPTSIFAVDVARPDADPALKNDVAIGDYVRLVGTQWEDSCHCQGIRPFQPTNQVDNLDLGAISRWIDGTFGHGVQVCPPAEPGHRVFCIQGRGWTEMHPVDYIATFPGPTHDDRFEVIAMAGAGEVKFSIKLPPKPSPNAHVSYREIDSPFTLLRAGEPALKVVSVTADGIFVHIKLDPRPGIAPGYPKFFAGFYVAWEQ
jgi:hypothetical protein